MAVILSLVGCNAEQEAPVEPVAADVTAEPTPEPTPVPTPELPAQLIPAPVRFNGGEVTAKVTDHFWNSRVFFGADDRLEAGSPEAEDISALYIVWIRQPPCAAFPVVVLMLFVPIAERITCKPLSADAVFAFPAMLPTAASFFGPCCSFMLLPRKADAAFPGNRSV